MIDSTDHNLILATQSFSQDYEQIVALLAFLDANLPKEQHDAFLALVWHPTQERAEAALVAAARDAKAAGLDPMTIVETAPIAGGERSSP